MRIGIVGYGAGGRYFHAPFIEAAEGVELVGIVARSEAKRAQAEADFPGLPVYGSLAGLLDAGVDAVTITTPPHRGSRTIPRKSSAVIFSGPGALKMTSNMTWGVLRTNDFPTSSGISWSQRVTALWR